MSADGPDGTGHESNFFYEFPNGGDLLKKFVVAICSVVLAFGLAGCWGKAPVGKGKAPVVQTRG
jgi:hypothetical protein